MTILDEIFAHKRQEVAQAKQQMPEADVAAAAAGAPPALDFAGALRASPMNGRARGKVSLIAEIKAASPSRGVLTADFDPLRLAKMYAENGASAISVLTDEHFFQGHLDILRQVRRLHPGMPLLRKDFLFDPYQVYEARASGADAVLLIAAMLEEQKLVELHTLAEKLGMAALVEVHNEAELRTALRIGSHLVGINNRDLHTFRVSLGVSLALRPLIPEDVTVVAESGIHSRQDVLRLAEAGVHAILVGEALVTAADIPEKVQELSGQSATGENSENSLPRRKFCEG